MIRFQRGSFHFEAAATPERDGFCCVTVEVFEGPKMIRGYYRRLQRPHSRYVEAEREIAEDVARMTGQAE